jgi:cysteine desulfurase
VPAPGAGLFTSGGTESNNMALKNAVHDLGVRRIISCPSEHHCNTHSIETLVRENNVEVVWLNPDRLGQIEL